MYGAGAVLLSGYFSQRELQIKIITSTTANATHNRWRKIERRRSRLKSASRMWTTSTSAGSGFGFGGAASG
jgi:hypothetical protein